MAVTYRTVVNQILTLKWESLNQNSLTWLMFVSHVTAREFAESLRVALRLYPNDPLLQSMADEELDTTNLQYDSYQQTGDHWQFLDHFLDRIIYPSHVYKAMKPYMEIVRDLSPRIRAMSIFSREEELPGIFTKILSAPVWQEGLPNHLEAFRFYLERHVELDSRKGGHGDLVGHYELTEELLPFYKARLQLYREALFDLV